MKIFIFRYVDAHYFGYMDEEDGQVMPLEEEAEKRAREEAIDNYKMDKELAQMKNSDDWDKGPCFRAQRTNFLLRDQRIARPDLVRQHVKRYLYRRSNG